MPTNVYIDGLNFYYGAVKGRPKVKWVDFEALCRKLIPKDTIGAIKYFTAVVKPRFPSDTSHERHNTLLRAIRTNPLIEIVEGRFRSDDKWRMLAEDDYEVPDLFRPSLRPTFLVRWLLRDARRRRTKPFTCAHVVVDEEKGSDVALGAHLVKDALTKACDKAIVITNDSDLVLPIRFAEESGVPVGLVNPYQPRPTSGHLKRAASFQIQFRPKVVGKCQMPLHLVDKKGRPIHCPAQWQ